MTPKSSDNLSKPLLVVGVGASLTAFTLQATPILVVTVALPLLSFITELLLLLFLISMVAGAGIAIGWLWKSFNDDLHKRRYWRERRNLDMAERKRRAALSTRSGRSTDPCMPALPRQPRPLPRRSNLYRPDDFR